MSQIFISKNNSTTTPLAANATFTGFPDTLTGWEELDINIAGAPSVAPATLYFEFSPDAINWDVSIPFTLTGPSIVPMPLRTVLPFFRVRYINGNIPLTQLRLTVVFHRTASTRLTRFLFQPLDVNEPIEVVRAAKIDAFPFTTSTTTSVASSVSSVVLLAANSIRGGATIFNESNSILYIKLGATASLVSYTVQVNPGGYFELPYGYNGEIDGIWASANGNARITELSYTT